MKTKTIPLLLLLSAATFAAPAGNVGATPPAAPEDALYEKNLVINPGFEKSGFEKDRKKGWYAELQNGMEAKFEAAAPNKPVQPFEGHKALRIFVKDPAKYSSKALLGSWDDFAHGANGGKGPPRADVSQYVPVKPGSKYALRFRWRASGIYNKAAPGPDRGVVSVTIRCDWIDANGRYIVGQTPFLPNMLASITADSDEWTTWAFPNFAPGAKLPYSKQMNVPFAPPAGAAYAKIFFRFTCQRPKVKPELWFDQVEFVEIPPDANLAPGAAQPAGAQGAKPAAQPAAPAGAQGAKPAASAAK